MQRCIFRTPRSSPSISCRVFFPRGYTTSTNKTTQRPPRRALTVPFPTTATCSTSSSCGCPISLPPDLEIDRKNALNGTMAAYAQQVLICTGQNDWTSRIEDDGIDKGWGILGRELKRLLGRGGQYTDPYHNVLLTNSSFAPASGPASTSTEPKTASVLLFPSFQYIPHIPLDQESVTKFVQGFLKPKTLHAANAALPDALKAQLTQAPEAQKSFNALSIKKSPIILICGHGGRDMRCGIYGPVLQEKFNQVLSRKKEFVVTQALEEEKEAYSSDGFSTTTTVHTALISHIGGHKYAGNVIIYVPPGAVLDNGQASPLAGMGIWYGRIEPKHVDGIVEETFGKGRVIEEFFRGGIGGKGEIFRL